MSEKGGPRPDATRLSWGGTETEFSPAKKLAGWAYAETIPYDGMNWRWSFQGDWSEWVHEVIIRQFGTQWEACGDPDTAGDDPVLVGDTWLWESRIMDHLGGKPGYLPDFLIGDPVVPTGDNCNAICTDGGFIYIGTDTHHVLRYGFSDGDLFDGSLLSWDVDVDPSMTGAEIRSLACDGRFVYVGWASGVGGFPNTLVLDAYDGSVEQSVAHVSGAGAVQDIASNGEFWVEVYGNGVVRCNAVGAPGGAGWSTVWEYVRTFGSAIVALALDNKYAYFGGDYETGKGAVQKFELSDPTPIEVWSVGLPTATDAEVRSLVVDEDFVYVGITPNTTSGTPAYDVNLFAIDKWEGSPWGWGQVPPVAQPVVALEQDDRYLYCQSTKFSRLRKNVTAGVAGISGAVAAEWNLPVCEAVDFDFSQERQLCSNGRTLFCAFDDTVVVIYGPNCKSKLMYRTDWSDPNRFPHFHIASPLYR